MASGAIVPCVGAIVFDEAGRLLLVRRGRPPAAGTWSIPGGRVEAGETREEAVVREVAEETGLRVTVTGLVGSVQRSGVDGATYDIADYACGAVAGEPVAGDDAAAVGWFGPGELDHLDLTPGLLHALRNWGVLP